MEAHNRRAPPLARPSERFSDPGPASHGPPAPDVTSNVYFSPGRLDFPAIRTLVAPSADGTKIPMHPHPRQTRSEAVFQRSSQGRQSSVGHGRLRACGKYSLEAAGSTLVSGPKLRPKVFIVWQDEGQSALDATGAASWRPVAKCPYGI